jgi:hypothetical protein
MFAMTFPAFIDTSMFAVKSSHSATALWLVSSLALASNVAVFVYQVYTAVKYKRNPIREELYTNLDAYKAVASN